MQWQYIQHESHKRDERIDFIRGFIMFLLIVIHIDILSIYTYIAWERFGVASVAEGFVLLSGIVIGVVNKRKIIHNNTIGNGNFTFDYWHLFDRSFQLYRVIIAVIISVPIINLLPFVDVSVAMTFKDIFNGKVYNLYPSFELIELKKIIADILLLKYGPHQFQVLGLYVVLMFFAPLALFLLINQRFKLLLSISWIIYLINMGYNHRIIGAQFEYAFPVLTWQLLFFHGIVIGYYKDEIWDFFHTRMGKNFFVFVVVLFLLGLFITYNHPYTQFPNWMKLKIIDSETFYKYYFLLFYKNTLEIGRVINDFALLIISYAILSYFWKPINRFIGWIFVPIGQASLYVFIWHLYFCILIANITPFQLGNIYLNSLAHTIVFASIWLLVKKKILFSIIPR